MKDATYYRQVSNFAIATEILADPEATTRERVLAQRIRGKHGDRSDDKHKREHAFD